MNDEGTQSSARLPGVQVAVIGGASCSQEEARHAEEIGRRVALAGAVLLCGGTTGVMEAACRGAQLAGGTTVGILPGKMIESGNPWLSVRLPTGMGNGRNWLVAAGAHAVIAIGGGLGTLSEIALALKAGKPVVGLGTWDAVGPDGAHLPVLQAQSAAEAAEAALAAGVAASRTDSAMQEEPHRRS